MNEQVTNVSPSFRPPPRLFRSNRLSIADLFLITFGTAFAIWILQPSHSPRVPRFVAVNVLMAPLYGSAVASVLIATYRVASDREPFAAEPGHWLLLIVGTTFSGIGLLTKGITAPHLEEPPQNLWIVVFIAAVFMGVGLIMVSIGVLVTSVYANDHQPRRWRLVFHLIGWTLLVSFLASLLLPAGGFTLTLIPLLIVISPVLVPIVMIAAVAIDLWQRTYRDHWHWLGVAAFLGVPLHIVLLIIAEQFAS